MLCAENQDSGVIFVPLNVWESISKTHKEMTRNKKKAWKDEFPWQDFLPLKFFFCQLQAPFLSSEVNFHTKKPREELEKTEEKFLIFHRLHDIFLPSWNNDSCFSQPKMLFFVYFQVNLTQRKDKKGKHYLIQKMRNLFSFQSSLQAQSTKLDSSIADLTFLG